LVKSGFSLIELIFAIVVMAIAISTLPSITNRVYESTSFSINQEVIWMASSSIYNILDYKWDESTSITGSFDRKVVDITPSVDTDSNFSRSGLYGANDYRIGHIVADGRRKFHSHTAPSFSSSLSNLGSDGSDLDDIDDFIMQNRRISYASLSSTLDYKHSDYNASIDVYYIRDKNLLAGESYRTSSSITFQLSSTPSGNPTNIKMIEFNISNPDGGASPLVKMYAFSSNIGEYFDLQNKVKE
jgi:prepilin-type N-terminal cleavage/methylation domain-containing protein